MTLGDFDFRARIYSRFGKRHLFNATYAAWLPAARPRHFSIAPTTASPCSVARLAQSRFTIDYEHYIRRIAQCSLLTGISL